MTEEQTRKLKQAISANMADARRKNFERLQKKLQNPALDDCTDAFLGLASDKKDTDLFYDYEDKRQIALSCLWELLDKTDKNFRFYLATDQRRPGILPDTQGLSSVGLILSDYGVLDADESVIDPDVLASIINAYADGVKSLLERYDAEGVTLSPYEDIGLSKGNYYYDSLTWLVSTLLQAVNLSDHPKFAGMFAPELIDKMLGIVHQGIVAMNKGFIPREDSSSFSQGWNFAQGCDHPSLVFSYVVSECYLDIYEFAKLCFELSVIEKRERAGKRLSADNILVKQEWERLSAGQQAERRRRYDIINQDNAFVELDKRVAKCGRDLWNNVKDDLAEQFYNNQVSDPVSPLAIRNSNSSDALFNDLFAINIIVAAGIDLDLSYQLLDAESDAAMAKIQSDLDYLNDSLQASLQRTVRYYNRFVSEKRDYIVNDFIVTCPEEFGDGEMARCAENLRKKRIKLFTLAPLIVKTNNLLADYLVQYPQKEMIKYVDNLILSRRNTAPVDPKIKQDSLDEMYRRDTQYLWIWENNDYLLTSNFYYLSALADFFRYQEEFEKRFQAISADNDKTRQAIEADHRKELGILEDEEVRELKNKAEELTRKEEELVILRKKNKELEAREEAVVKALKEMITKEVRSNMVNWFVELVDEAKAEVSKSLFAPEHDFETPISVYKEDFAEAHPQTDRLLSAVRDLQNLPFYAEIGHVLLDNFERKGAASRMESGFDILDKYDRRNVADIVANEISKTKPGK